MKSAIKLFSALLTVISCSSLATDTVERDEQGRQILRGTQYGHSYNNVHIIADSVGVASYFGGVYIRNSVIEARTCVQTRGIGLTLHNNILKWGLCIEFTGGQHCFQ